MKQRLKQYIITSTFVFITSSCVNKYSKDNFVGTQELKETIYRERFQIHSGGVFAGDSYSDYLTDSVNFRKYVGTAYHDNEMLIYALSSDTVVDVYKITWNFSNNDTLKIASYNFNDLIRLGKFD